MVPLVAFGHQTVVNQTLWSPFCGLCRCVGMSFPHLGSVLLFAVLMLMSLRSARRTFVFATRERERLAHTVAALVVGEVCGAPSEGGVPPEERLAITGHGGDLFDVEVLAYTAVPGSGPGRMSHRELLAQGEEWNACGPPGPSRTADVRWIVWWTCPAGYRWRLTVHGRHRHDLQYVARPSGSAPRRDSRLTRLRNAAWPYTFATTTTGHGSFWTPPNLPVAEAEEEDPTEVLVSPLIPFDRDQPETMIDDFGEAVTPFAPGRIPVG